MSLATIARSLAGAKGRGWHPSIERPTDRVYKPRMSAPREGAPRLAECVPGVFNQGGTSSCVAQSIAGAIGTRERYLGLPFTFAEHGISRRDLYYRSRYTHGDQNDDAGTYIPVAFDQMRKFGVAPESAFPWSELYINKGAPAHLLHAGYERSGLVYERIIAGGDAKLEALAAAFAEGLPVVFGTQVPHSFPLYAGGAPYEPRPSDGNIGGHAMYCVDIDPITGDVLLINSWGRGFGEQGRAWCKAQWVKDAWRDLHVLRGWRRVRTAEALHHEARESRSL